MSAGYRARLEPIRVIGTWPQLGVVPDSTPALSGEPPVAVLTLGKLRPHRLLAFLRASAAAERAVLSSPALVLSTGMAAPTGLVCTFSVWDDIPAMRAVINGGHRVATDVNDQRPFHRASAFIRYRVREQTGTWNG
jgi:hypothetical protein